MDSTSTRASVPIARPVMSPRQGRVGVSTYAAESFAGDASLTWQGTPILAPDREPAGLARVTLAMRPEPSRPPAPGRLIGLCAWAAGVGMIGVIIALWAGITQLAGAPTWFLPTAGGIGLAGVCATMGAFVTARRHRTPWALLSAATLALIVASIVIAVA